MRHMAISAPEEGNGFTPGIDIASDYIGSLPTLSPDQCSAIVGLYRPRGALQLDLAGMRATFALTWPPARPLPGRRSVVRLSVDEDEAELRISKTLIERLLQRVDNTLSLDRLTPEHAALMVEFGLEGSMEALEAVLGSQLSLLSIVPESDVTMRAEQIALPFGLAVEGLGSTTGELRILPHSAEGLTRLLDQRTTAKKFDLDLPVVTALRIAAVTLTTAEIRSLGPGDVVLVDRAGSPVGTAVLVFGEYLVAPVELTPAGSRLLARPMRGRGSAWEWSMENPTETARNGAPQDAGLGDLPVQVRFEFGRVELPLNEIQNLAPGTILQLARSPSEAVDIVANGKRIGLGAMVRIGDSLGVRITRLFENA